MCELIFDDLERQPSAPFLLLGDLNVDVARVASRKWRLDEGPLRDLRASGELTGQATPSRTCAAHCTGVARTRVYVLACVQFLHL
eukprot:4748099-Alexandrium_andersonii.AAC.1